MKYGFVRTDKGNLRPFLAIREIQRGRNKGRFEVKLPSGRPQKIVVRKEEIHRFPAKDGEDTAR